MGMLILERSAQPEHNEIIIGDRDVVIKILRASRGKVKIGIITKDPNVPIHRAEVFERTGPVLLKDAEE